MGNLVVREVGRCPEPRAEMAVVSGPNSVFEPESVLQVIVRAIAGRERLSGHGSCAVFDRIPVRGKR